MLIFVTIMFLLPLGLLTLHLYLSGVFTNRRAFQLEEPAAGIAYS